MLWLILLIVLVYVLTNTPLTEKMHVNDGTYDERTIRHIHDHPGQYHYVPFLQSPFLWYPTDQLPRRLLPPWYTMINDNRMQTPQMQLLPMA